MFGAKFTLVLMLDILYASFFPKLLFLGLGGAKLGDISNKTQNQFVEQSLQYIVTNFNIMYCSKKVKVVQLDFFNGCSMWDHGQLEIQGSGLDKQGPTVA